MPISNPSYFPPSRANGSVVGITAGQTFTGARSFLAMANAGNFSTLDDIIVIGQGAFSTGVTYAPFAGSIVLGTGIMADFIDGSTAPGEGALVLIGNNVAAAMQYGGDGSVIIGDHAMASCIGIPSNRIQDVTIIGALAAQNITTTADQCVIIGSRAGQAPQNAASSIAGSTVIGSQVCETFGSTGSITNSVIVGSNQSCAGIHQSANSVVVGSFSIAAGLSNAVLIGSATLGNDSSNAILIGDNNTVVLNNSIAIGGSIPGTATGSVLIGPFVNNIAAHLLNVFLLESGDGSPNSRRLIKGYFGDLEGADQCNLVLGDSNRTGLNDTLPAGAVNAIKIMNGAAGVGAPVSGGYFYVNAGELHWIGTDDTDTKLSSGTSPASFPDGWVVGAVAAVTAAGDATVNSLLVNTHAAITAAGDATVNTVTTGILAGSGGLIATSAALTDHSAAAAGTLLNSPAAGNPTKWIAINDNGTLRGIPTWLI